MINTLTHFAKLGAVALALGGSAASFAACEIISLPIRADGGSAEQLIATTPSATTATTTVIYNNYALPPFPYDAELGVGITGSQSAWHLGYQAYAVPFTPSRDVVLTRAMLAFFVAAGDPGELRIGIHQDAVGKPGTALKSVATSGLVTGVNTIRFGQVPLTGGVPYWLVVRPKVAASTTSVTWSDNCSDDLGPEAFNTGRGWQVYDLTTRPAMKLVGQY